MTRNAPNRRLHGGTAGFAGVTSIAVDEHTVEFGPDFPPDDAARDAWREIARAFYLDRFGGRPVWLAADWERTRAWPTADGLEEERVLQIDGLELHAARYSLVDEPFVERLLQSPGFQWDGILAIDHVGSFDDLTIVVRQWFDSIGNERSLLRTDRDAVYPVADGFGLRWANATRPSDALIADVERTIAGTSHRDG